MKTILPNVSEDDVHYRSSALLQTILFYKLNYSYFVFTYCITNMLFWRQDKEAKK